MQANKIDVAAKREDVRAGEFLIQKWEEKPARATREAKLISTF